MRFLTGGGRGKWRQVYLNDNNKCFKIYYKDISIDEDVEKSKPFPLLVGM